ncbi:hypothetical protein I6E29_04225 [Arcanobacterium haemolyticum]|nr:hypothetical protein [Arcanobacterium haemolyticum]
MRTVFCGLTTIDFIQKVGELPGPNTKVQSESAILDVGGPAANAARTAAALGAYPTLVSPIGPGIFGEMASQWLEESHVAIVDLADEGDPSVSSVVVDAHGQRNVVSSNSAGRSHRFPEANILDGATALLLDGHLLDVQIALARTAKAQGIPVVLDGGSYKSGIESLIPHCSHIIVSADFHLPGVADDVLLETLAWRGATLVARTRGDEPVEAVYQEKAYSLPVQVVDVVDTLGAGDVLHGAFTAALGAGEDPLESLAAASSLATLSVQGDGVMAWAKLLEAEVDEES